MYDGVLGKREVNWGRGEKPRRERNDFKITPF